MDADKGLHVVRLFDMFDGWVDVSEPLSLEAAQALWSEKTKGGTANTKFDDGDYYKVFPADTTMIMTPEFLGR